MLKLTSLLSKFGGKAYPDIPIEEARFVVVDTELTGLDSKKNSIVSIGAVEMEGGRIKLGTTFYRLVNPQTGLTAESVVIHEITPSDVITEPDISSVLQEFLGYLRDAVIVGFCVGIDMEFLNLEIKRLAGAPLRNPAVDIRLLFEWLKAKKGLFSDKAIDLATRYKLYDLAGVFGIAVNGSHNALADAYITAQIFQRLIPVLNRAGITGTSDLLSLGDPEKGGDSLSSSQHTLCL